jgi:predicted restriction endonuclease
MKPGSLPNHKKAMGVNLFLDPGMVRHAARLLQSPCCNQSILKASHIKPWRDCSDEERLDPYNGLLLIPNLDAAFDRGLMTFNPEGRIMLSPLLSKEDQRMLSISESMTIDIKEENHKYMDYHRDTVFRK